MEIKATVKFNGGKAYIFKNIEEYKYYRINNDIIYGTDGIRYICYKYDPPSGRVSAFGGRKFEIKIEDTGEIVECYGQWWDGGYDKLVKHLNLDLISITYNTDEELKKCYVYYGACVDKTKFESILKESGDLFYYGYYDYEKVLKYQEMWSSNYDKIVKLEKDKKNLINQCKILSNKLKYFKNQIIIDKWK